MAVERQRLRINTDTGAGGDTGPSFFGAIQQMRWVPTTGDTGGDLLLALLPIAGDTGGGYVFYSDNDCLGSAFTKVPLQPGHASDGFDTGVDQYFPIVAAGDRIRAKATPGGTAIVGDLYIWTYTG